MSKKTVIVISVVLFIILLSGLLAPRSNPPIENTVIWNSEETRDQFMISCANCHSHETKWPWYSYVGPVAFFVTYNVNEGREHFNISHSDMGHSREAGEEVLEGYMPPSDYLFMHSEAKLEGEIKKRFASGLVQTFGGKIEHNDEEEKNE